MIVNKDKYQNSWIGDAYDKTVGSLFEGRKDIIETNKQQAEYQMQQDKQIVDFLTKNATVGAANTGNTLLYVGIGAVAVIGLAIAYAYFK